MILSCYKGKNADLIKHVAAQYFQEGFVIADVTYGKGNFWTKTDLSKCIFYPSDILTGIDFRALPYAENFFDVVAFDPPYVHNDGGFKINASYNNASIQGKHTDVIKLYEEGLKEVYRVLKPGGIVLVKCQDTVEYRQQRWAHIEIHDLAIKLNYYPKDLFVLHQDTLPMRRNTTGDQGHARKNHSYLWIFKKRIRREKIHKSKIM